MRFEFTPSNHSESFNEYTRYIYQQVEIINVYKKAVLPGIITFISYIIIASFSQYYHYLFKTSLILVVVLFIVFLTAFLTIFLFKKVTKKVKNNALYADLESNFTFTIEDGYLTRENKFSTIKIAIKSFDKMQLLKESIILCYGKHSLFIPKAVLPVTQREFIKLFKTTDSKIILEDPVLEEKNQLLKDALRFIILCFLSLAVSYFVGKYDYEHNFTTYTLIMSDELESLSDNSLLYKNENLGYTIVFPESWTGKFGIEELENHINVYYLVNGVQGPSTSILFTLREEMDPPPLDKFDKISFAFDLSSTYTFWSPKEIYMNGNYKAYSEYADMFKEILNLKFRII